MVSELSNYGLALYKILSRAPTMLHLRHDALLSTLFWNFLRLCPFPTATAQVLLIKLFNIFLRTQI